MNLHEYQAKELFGQYGIAVPQGRVVASIGEAERAVFGEAVRLEGQRREGRVRAEEADRQPGAQPRGQPPALGGQGEHEPEHERPGDVDGERPPREGAARPAAHEALDPVADERPEGPGDGDDDGRAHASMVRVAPAGPEGIRSPLAEVGLAYLLVRLQRLGGAGGGRRPAAGARRARAP